MPRAMWKGAISFGLVTIPVAVFPATEEKTVRFNQLHDEDMGRIRQKRVCEKDGEIVDYEHIVKGYEYEKDRYVVLTDEDFDAVPVESSRAIDIVQFVDLDEIDPMMFKKSYYLAPDETGAKAYSLLRQAHEHRQQGRASPRSASATRSISRRCGSRTTRSCWRRCTGPTRSAPPTSATSTSRPTVRDQELEMARQLIEGLTAEWDPEEFTDEYREALLRIVEAKINGEEIEVVEAEPTAKVVDLMEALKASVAAARSRRTTRTSRPTVVRVRVVEARSQEDRCEEGHRQEVDGRRSPLPGRRPSGSEAGVALPARRAIGRRGAVAEGRALGSGAERLAGGAVLRGVFELGGVEVAQRRADTG